jgi:hypothetical protein
MLQNERRILNTLQQLARVIGHRKLRTKKYMLALLGIFVPMAFIVSCQQEGTTVTEESANGSPAYMNRPAPSPTR